jgi:sec-independent protein translocase protein TatA
MIVLFLNSIAGSEVIIIMLFILVFFGAKSIPGFSRSLGRGIRQIKDASEEVKSEIRKTTGDMKADMNLKRNIEEVTTQFKKPLKEMEKNIESSTKAAQQSFEVNAKSIAQKAQKAPDNQKLKKESDSLENKPKEEKGNVD